MRLLLGIKKLSRGVVINAHGLAPGQNFRVTRLVALFILYHTAFRITRAKLANNTFEHGSTAPATLWVPIY